jgi:Glycosyl transferase family 2
VAAIIFYLSAALLLYAYVLYPLLLAAYAALAPRRAPAVAAEDAPSLSVIVAAYNEEAVIAQKIANFLRCDYPAEAEMIVVADGCEDRTADIAERLAGDRVRVIRRAVRTGKGAALNAGVAAARGEILVFTDANTMFEPDALAALMRPFADPSIGLVTGVSRYPDGTIGSAYQRYEQMLKEYESALGVVATADGAIYAMRRRLFTEMDPRLINDFMHPILAALAGADSVMAREAAAVEDFSTDGEFARQIRMVSQAAMVYFRFLPDLVRKRRWRSIAVLTSHKLLRWMTAPLLAMAAAATLVMAPAGGIYALALAGEVLFAAAAAAGLIARRRGVEGKATFAYQFIALNCAQAVGLWRCFVGEVPVMWRPRNL